MIGDKILVYDDDKKMFFAGWAMQKTSYSVDPPTPTWSKTVDDAKVSQMLMHMCEVARMLGPSARIVSETRARQIEAELAYRRETKIDAPCRGCHVRTVGCHVQCKLYHKYTAEINARRAAERVPAQADAHTREVIDKIKKRGNMG